MEVQSLNNLITKNHLKRVAADIREMACQSIRLLAAPAGGELVTGASRFGGQPDLPDGFPWPVWRGKPMSFVAQICLEDVAGFSPAHDLPASGLLSFFFDSAQEAYGASPEDRGGWAVSFFEPAAALVRTPFPPGLAEEAHFKPLTLSYHSEWTLPSDPRQARADLDWNDQERRAYEDLLRELHGPGDRKIPQHRMFGWPDQLQDDMQLQAALMFHGIREMNDPREKEVAKTKGDWLLLLQVDSDDRAGMRWASYGMIYNWIEEQALQDRQFDQTWVILQSD